MHELELEPRNEALISINVERESLPGLLATTYVRAQGEAVTIGPNGPVVLVALMDVTSLKRAIDHVISVIQK